MVVGEMDTPGQCCGDEEQCVQRTKRNWTKTAHCMHTCIQLGLELMHMVMGRVLSLLKAWACGGQAISQPSSSTANSNNRHTASTVCIPLQHLHNEWVSQVYLFPTRHSFGHFGGGIDSQSVSLSTAKSKHKPLFIVSYSSILNSNYKCVWL